MGNNISKTSNIILQANNLRVSRGGVTILDIAGLMVHEGEVLSLIGPNGAGKQPFYRIFVIFINSLKERCCSGENLSEKTTQFLSIEGELPWSSRTSSFDTTVFKNVASGLKFRGVDKKEIEKRVAENLERFGIAHLRDRSAGHYQG